MASLWTNKGLYLLITAGVNMASASGLKFGLLVSSYTPVRTANFASDISASEPSISGYVGGFNGSGRKALTSKTATEDDTNHRAVCDAADPSQYTLGAGATLRHAFIVLERTSDADSEVLLFMDMGADKVTNGGTMDFQFSANGYGYLQA